jgi:hypothetical protein
MSSTAAFFPLGHLRGAVLFSARLRLSRFMMHARRSDPT